MKLYLSCTCCCLCFQGKRGWDPVGSTERELEENSVYSEVYVEQGGGGDVKEDGERKIAARPLRSEGGDMEAIKRLNEFFAFYEEMGEVLQTGNDTIVLLVHKACLVTTLMEMLDELLTCKTKTQTTKCFWKQICGCCVRFA